MGKKLLSALLFGGCVGIVGQGLIMLAAGFVPDPTLATIIAMLVFGIISAILIATGVYDKLAKFAGFGADQPLCGLMFGATCMARMAVSEGAPKGKAIVQGFVKVMMIAGIGFIISAIIGVILG